MKKVSLKECLKTLRYEVIQYNNNYNSRTGFAKKDGQLFYFSFEDLRDIHPTLMIRTADENKKDKNGKYNDFTGGRNTYPNLESIGLYIVEKRKRCDFNAC